MGALLLIASLGMPFIWHCYSFDRTEVSARCAFLIGITVAAYAWLQLSWQMGILAFFLATFGEFAVAYAIGLIYEACGTPERTEYLKRLKSAPPNNRREMVGALGAIAIPVCTFVAWLAVGLQNGTWELPPTKPLLGFCAFLILGIATVVRLAVNRKTRKAKEDAAA